MRELPKMASPSAFPAKPPNLRVGSAINGGAWGVIYEGDLDGRPVAVKSIHKLLRQEGNEGLDRLLDKFREECARLQALVHPNIVGKEHATCSCLRAYCYQLFMTAISLYK